MVQRPFGFTKREVAIIGQGTWYLEDGDPPTAIAALRPLRAITLPPGWVAAPQK